MDSYGTLKTPPHSRSKVLNIYLMTNGGWHVKEHRLRLDQAGRLAKKIKTHSIHGSVPNQTCGEIYLGPVRKGLLLSHRLHVQDVTNTESKHLGN